MSTVTNTPLPTPYISYWQTQFDAHERLSEEATILERLQYAILDGDSKQASLLLT